MARMTTGAELALLPSKMWSSVRSQNFFLYWLIVLIGTVVDQATSLIPSVRLRLPMQSFSAHYGYVPPGAEVHVAGHLFIVNVVHSYRHFNIFGADQTVRLLLACMAGLAFTATIYKNRLVAALFRAALTCWGTLCFSQALSLLVPGGVVDWILWRSAHGRFTTAYAFSDLAFFAGCGLFLLAMIVLGISSLALARQALRFQLRRSQESS